jgi:hypothetical protein
MFETETLKEECDKIHLEREMLELEHEVLKLEQRKLEMELAVREKEHCRTVIPRDSVTASTSKSTSSETRKLHVI